MELIIFIHADRTLQYFQQMTLRLDNESNINTTWTTHYKLVMKLQLV